MFEMTAVLVNPFSLAVEFFMNWIFLRLNYSSILSPASFSSAGVASAIAVRKECDAVSLRVTSIVFVVCLKYRIRGKEPVSIAKLQGRACH